MSQNKPRLVPYRSLTQIQNSAAFGSVAYVLVGLPVRIEFEVLSGALAGLAAMALTHVVMTSLARHGGAELVTPQESKRRLSQERAARTLWGHSLETAIGFAMGTTAGFLVVVDPVFWQIVPVATLAALLVGLFAGAYSWIDARRDTSATPKVEDLQPVSMLQAAMRHYLGYTGGLAAGLCAATLFDDRTIATVSLFIAFLLVKFAIDTALPREAQPKLKRLGIMQRIGYVLVAIPFGVVWWGLPLATLAVAMAHTYLPGLDHTSLWKVFATVSLSSGLLASFAFVATLLMNLVPEFDGGGT